MFSTMLVSGATVVATLSLPSCSVKLSSVPASPAPGLDLLDEQPASKNSASRANAAERRQWREAFARGIGSPSTRYCGSAMRRSHYTAQLQAVAIASLCQKRDCGHTAGRLPRGYLARALRGR